MTFRKPQLIPLLFIVFATALLCALGAWQVQRMVWKNNLIAEIASAQSQASLSVLRGESYRRVELEGKFVTDKFIRIVGRPQYEEKNGYFLLYPFTMKDGNTVLINIGWAPAEWKADLSAQTHVTGIVRPPRGKRPFSPTNHPDKNIWFYEDMPAIGQSLGLTLQDRIVEAVGTRIPGNYPVMSDGKISMRNDHLGYAITWFSLAFIGLIMFAIYHRAPEKKP